MEESNFRSKELIYIIFFCALFLIGGIFCNIILRKFELDTRIDYCLLEVRKKNRIKKIDKKKKFPKN